MGAFHNTTTLELSPFDSQRTTQAQPSAFTWGRSLNQISTRGKMGQSYAYP